MWKYKNFYKNSPEVVSQDLVKFLNEYKIENFKVVQMSNQYIEIVFKSNNLKG